ncbi:hypothetical protein MRB53_000987 [Persea americana]|uniref:Uncharacterized protein n=1 Tax=Persea americana TaxID=3435 RepID=A0ACC2MQF4_PERAE|nr:hypothetical protein MRB53_000987 [Persea americana]
MCRILVAVLTVFERVGDTFVSWLPMYSEAKLAFFVYLWYPKTKGTTYVYDAFLRPYVAKHETEIDRNLLELRARAGDIAVLYWQKAASYGQTRIFDILQYFASQSSTPRPPRPSQQQSGNHQPTPTVSSRQPPPTAPPRQPPTSPTRQSAALQSQQPPSRQPATTSTSQKQESAQESVSNSATVAPKAPKQIAHSQANSEASTAQSATAVEEEAMQIDSTLVENGGANPTPQEIVMEESLRMTRARMRKNRAAANRQ